MKVKRSGHYEIFKLIIDYVDDKNPARHDGVTPLHMTAKKGYFEIFKLILQSLGKNEKTPKVDRGPNGGYTPLHIAAKNGHLGICKTILEEVDNKNPVTNLGWTPLHFAADSGHLEVFKFISQKVSVKNPKTNDGSTPQDLAAMYCKRFIDTTHGNNMSESMLDHIHTTTTNMSISSLIWERIKNLWK